MTSFSHLTLLRCKEVGFDLNGWAIPFHIKELRTTDGKTYFSRQVWLVGKEEYFHVGEKAARWDHSDFQVKTKLLQGVLQTVKCDFNQNFILLLLLFKWF